MRILFLGQSLNEQSGWGRYGWEVARRLSQVHEVKVLVEEGSGKKLEEVVLQKTTGILKLIKNIKIAKHFAKDFDILHALDGWPYGVLAACAARGKPYFINGAGTYAVAPLEDFSKSIFLKWSYRKARAVFCISNFTKQEILRNVKLKNLQVVHLGIDHKIFRHFNISRDPNLVIGVGAVKPRKGYHIALQAVKILKPKFPGIRYQIVGSLEQESYVRKLKQFLRENHLEQNVVFTPNLSDEELVNLYNRARAFFLLPVNIQNHFEGFGLVFLEAASCGLPVVGTLGNGDEDAVLAYQNGFLVPQNNAMAAAKALEKILSYKDLWERFSRVGQQFAQNFTWEKTVEAYLQVYAQG